MFGNTLLLCGAGQENNGPVISEIKLETVEDGCFEGLWDPDTSYFWLKINKLESNYALVQRYFSHEDPSKATTVKCNIGACTLKDGYRKIDALAVCGPPGIQVARMCWADAAYNQISDWSDWKSSGS